MWRYKKEGAGKDEKNKQTSTPKGAQEWFEEEGVGGPWVVSVSDQRVWAGAPSQMERTCSSAARRQSTWAASGRPCTCAMTAVGAGNLQSSRTRAKPASCNCNSSNGLAN